MCPSSALDPDALPEALVLFEIDGMARAIACQDAALKRAQITILACAPISPGRAILIFAADVASAFESLAAVDDMIGSRQIDRLVLPGVHPEVIRALGGHRVGWEREALGVFELATVASAIEAADAAVKATGVGIGRLHPATGFGGKGLLTLFGPQPDVEAAEETVVATAAAKVLDHVVIPAPHDELKDGAFLRPWPLDPAD